MAAGQETSPDNIHYSKGNRRTFLQLVARRVWNFGRAIQSNSEFFMHTQALKGAGATAFAASIAAGTIFYMHVPLFLAAAGVGLCAGVAAFGAFGAALAAKSAAGILWDVFKQNVLNKTPPSKGDPQRHPLSRKIMESNFMRAVSRQPLVKVLGKSKLGRAFTAVARDPKNLIFNGFAVEGSAIWFALSIGTLAAGVVALPVVAASGIATFAMAATITTVAMAAMGVAGNTYGLIKGLRNLKEYMKQTRDDFKLPRPQTGPISDVFSMRQAKKLSMLFGDHSGRKENVSHHSRVYLALSPGL